MLNNFRSIAGQCAWLLAWQVAASLAFLLVTGIVLGLPAWQLGRPELLPLGFSYIAFFCSTAIPLVLAFTGHRNHWAFQALVCALAFSGVWCFVWVLGLQWPAGLALATACLTLLITLFLGPAQQSRSRKLGALLITSALIALLSLPATRSPWLYRGLEKPFSYLVETTLHRVQVNLFREHVRRTKTVGGGLAAAGEKVLLVTGDGLFYLLDIAEDAERLSARLLKIRAPINRDDFEALPYEFLKTEHFRTMGLLALDTPGSPDEVRILVSHHYWHQEQACYVLRVSSLATRWRDLDTGTDPPDWQTLFETEPCMPLKVAGNVQFFGYMSGGRMLQLDSEHILLTVGGHGFDGVNADLKVSQEMAMSFGKTIEIDITTGSSRVFTAGHRNSQGLHRDSQGRIWSTDHGPKGGDELNRMHDGSNYGWPLITLGANYGSYSWPLIEDRALHPDFIAPVFAWSPSIGVSNLTSVEGGEFERWQGDLIVASLVGRSLYRVHLENDQPILAEPIPVQERLRDIVRDSTGRIVFLTEQAAIGVLKKAAEMD